MGAVGALREGDQRAGGLMLRGTPLTPHECVSGGRGTRSALLYQQTSAHAGGAARIRVGHAQVDHDAGNHKGQAEADWPRAQPKAAQAARAT